MKKIFLLIFVTFCSLIFYQIILGKNGIIEGYRVSKDKEKIILKKIALMKEIDDLKSYIKYLKTDPSAFKNLANELGYFNEEVKLIKVLDEIKDKNINFNDLKFNVQNGNVDTAFNDEIKKIRLWSSIFFYVFFGLFILLIIFGINNKNEEDN